MPSSSGSPTWRDASSSFTRAEDSSFPIPKISLPSEAPSFISGLANESAPKIVLDTCICGKSTHLCNRPIEFEIEFM